MYAVRADSSRDLPGRPVAHLAAEHPAMDRSDDAAVFDDVTDWVDDLDLSLDPIVATRRPSRRRSPLLVAFIGVAFLMMLGLGVLGAVVIGGAATAAALLLFAPRVAAPPELPLVLDPTPIEIVAPLEVRAPTARRSQPPAKAPARPTPAPAGAPDAPPGSVDAEMVIMPDPGFKTVPVDRAIRKLHDKAGNGEIGAVAGH